MREVMQRVVLKVMHENNLNVLVSPLTRFRYPRSAVLLSLRSTVGRATGLPLPPMPEFPRWLFRRALTESSTSRSLP
jgi:hypothetical protein